MSPFWTQFPERGLKFFEKSVKFSENRLKLPEKKTGAKMKIWNIRDAFGQLGQVRLTEEGRLEVKSCGCRLWRLISYIDISLFSARDIKNALKATEGIREVKSQKG